jgi:hypothetical protein
VSSTCFHPHLRRAGAHEEIGAAQRHASRQVRLEEGAADLDRAGRGRAELVRVDQSEVSQRPVEGEAWVAEGLEPDLTARQQLLVLPGQEPELPDAQRVAL